ncbi:MAG TPA: ABC-type transport auxiliary lipoprotein family protein [Rhizomicrobium sp.]
MTHSPIVAAAFSRRAVLAAGAASGLLAGCGGNLIGPSQEPPQIYVLKPQLTPLDTLPSVAWQLSVAQPEAPQALETVRIALQRGQTMDYYANAQWTDPTPRLLQSLLIEAFESSGCIRGVAPEAAGVRADYVLETEIRSFEAQYQAENGAPDINVHIVARLVTAGRGEVVGTFEAGNHAPAAQNTVPAVVQAFGEATGQTLEDIVRWSLKAGAEKGRNSAPGGKSP